MSRSLFEQIIQFAIDKEKDSINFYEDLARKVVDPLVKDEILRMADEERKHEKILKQISPKNIDLSSKKGITDLALTRFGDDVAVDQHLDVDQLYMIAINREQKSYELYQELELRAVDDATRKIFTLLKGEEMRHRRQLERKYSKIKPKQD